MNNLDYLKTVPAHELLMEIVRRDERFKSIARRVGDTKAAAALTTVVCGVSDGSGSIQP